VLWVSVAAGALFFASTRGLVTEIARQKAALQSVRAQAAARAGLEQARYILATRTEDPNTTSVPASSGTDASLSLSELDQARFFLLAESDEDGEPALGLVDLSSKLNLNTATLAAIEALPDMTAELAAAIMDFRDADDIALPYGAESAVYLALPSPYRAKNAPFESLSELLLVRGMTAAVLFGEDTNLNGVLDPNEDDGARSFPKDSSDGVLDRGLYPFVTVTSASRLRPEGDDWVDLNNDPMSQIRSVLGSRLSPDAMFRLLRTLYPRGRSGPRRRLAGLADLLRSFPDFASGSLRGELGTIFRYATVSGDATAQGLVNVNTAPQEVLRTLPSIDDSLAIAIVAERDAGGHDFSTPCWLLDVPGVSPEVFAALVPLVSANSVYYQADCVGTDASGVVSARFIATIDCTVPEMNVVSTQVWDCVAGAVDLKGR
jgi:DNA uptake protein ComE-like DNA-binding protein